MSTISAKRYEEGENSFLNTEVELDEGTGWNAATGVSYLAISEQGWEVEEEGLAQGNCLDWVVKVFTFVKLHLESRKQSRACFRN